MEGEMRRLNQELLELEQIKEEVKSMEIKDRELRENAEVYSILRDRVFHKKGIVMHAINRLLPVLSVETSTELADLTDGRFSGVEIKPIAYEGGKRYGISIDVFGVDGSWHDVQEFSGGERTQINAALRFSIAKELASLPRIGKTYGRMRTLFIDEGDLGSLDTEVSRELFVKKLFDMQRFFDKIILITHLTEVADKFPNKIKISMTSTGESMAS
jgi:DNA repair exonuclease SbcCD ATPase subunit